MGCGGCDPGSAVMSRYMVKSQKCQFLTLMSNSRFICSLSQWFHGGSDNEGYRTKQLITSGPESDTFITLDLAFGCQAGCPTCIFDVGLLFLYTAVAALGVRRCDA